ncbi:10634_t:CDS:2 [Acaulospora morrowiae]|uniref:10634_t:CDS:1 n=1 Tax=Acaulospora morrowiae TaxID=94023 RepID=A0A9N9AJF9_9GLOM|nr:10634_t:CDS:2 [Acaulospora morrowiae]
MSSYTIPKSFNANSLKLTPEKLAEWSKRSTSNALPFSRAIRQKPLEPSNHFSFASKKYVNDSGEKGDDAKTNAESSGITKKVQQIHSNLCDDDNDDKDYRKLENSKKNVKFVDIEHSSFESQSFENIDVMDVDIVDLTTCIDPQDQTVADENASNDNRTKLFVGTYADNQIDNNSESSSKHDCDSEKNAIIIEPLQSYSQEISRHSSSEEDVAFTWTLQEDHPHSRLINKSSMKENTKLLLELDRILGELELSMKSVQELQLSTDKELDSIERSLEPFEDELRKMQGEMCDLKNNIARQISIGAIEQIQECIHVFEKVKTKERDPEAENNKG